MLCIGIMRRWRTRAGENRERIVRCLSSRIWVYLSFIFISGVIIGSISHLIQKYINLILGEREGSCSMLKMNKQVSSAMIWDVKIDIPYSLSNQKPVLYEQTIVSLLDKQLVGKSWPLCRLLSTCRFTWTSQANNAGFGLLVITHLGQQSHL